MPWCRSATKAPERVKRHWKRKIFRTENLVFPKNFRFRCYPESIFRPNFGFFGFKIQKFKKIHKNENRIFPTGFRCFPVGFRCFSGGKDCFSNVKNILVYMVLQKNYYTCIYNLNMKYPFKFRKNNISLTWLNTYRSVYEIEKSKLLISIPHMTKHT